MLLSNIVNNMGTSFGGYWFEDNRDDIGNWNGKECRL